MANDVGSNSTLNGVIFNHNTAVVEAGGLYNYSNSTTLNDVSFFGNSASGSGYYFGGGGLFNSWASADLTNVVFSGNTAALELVAGYTISETTSTIMLHSAIILPQQVAGYNHYSSGLDIYNGILWEQSISSCNVSGAPTLDIVWFKEAGRSRHGP